MTEFHPPEGLQQIIREAIERACPTEEQCLADEAECFKAHPIHEFASREGRLEAVYADVDGLVGIVLAALFEACTVHENPHMWLGDGTRGGRSLVLRFPLPDEPMPEPGPMPPELAAALAKVRAKVAAEKGTEDAN